MQRRICSDLSGAGLAIGKEGNVVPIDGRCDDRDGVLEDLFLRRRRLEHLHGQGHVYI